MGRWVPKGEWTYENQTRQIRSTRAYKCVATDGEHLVLEACNETTETQKWTWAEIYLA